MQKKVLFLVQVVWNQTSCNSTNKQVCKLRIEVSFEINFVKTSHFCTSTGYFEREKKYIGILNIFVRDFFFYLILFFCFQRIMKNWTVLPYKILAPTFENETCIQIMLPWTWSKIKFDTNKLHNTKTTLLKIANLLFCS